MREDREDREDRKLSALYHSADKPQPPTALDESIRAAAHQAIKTKRSHAPQWLGGIAAGLFAVLLITQLLPTLEQEADIAPGLYNAPRPAMDAVAPERTLTEGALAPAASPSVKKKAEAERARASKRQPSIESLELYPEQDEADATFSNRYMLESLRNQIVPQASPASPEMELKTITDLLDAGKTHEARQRLDDFRKRYPGVTIPQTITQRLPK